MRRTMESNDDEGLNLPRTPGHDIAAFVLLAGGLAWAAALAGPTGFALAVGAASPGIGALAVVAARGGRRGVAALLGRLAVRDTAPRRLAEAMLLPLGTAAVLALALGAFGSPIVRGIVLPDPPLLLAVLALAAGQELGWRGFLLPALLERARPQPAIVLASVIHVAWALPWLLVPGQVLSGVGFGSLAVFVVGLTTAVAWLHLRSRGSVLAAAVMHAAILGTSVLYGGILAADGATLAAVGYGLLALWLIATAPALHLQRASIAPLPR